MNEGSLYKTVAIGESEVIVAAFFNCDWHPELTMTDQPFNILKLFNFCQIPDSLVPTMCGRKWHVGQGKAG